MALTAYRHEGNPEVMTILETPCALDITMHEAQILINSLFSVDKKNQLDVTFVFFISLLIVAQHVSGNHVPIIRS